MNPDPMRFKTRSGREFVCGPGEGGKRKSGGGQMTPHEQAAEASGHEKRSDFPSPPFLHLLPLTSQNPSNKGKKNEFTHLRARCQGEGGGEDSFEEEEVPDLQRNRDEREGFETGQEPKKRREKGIPGPNQWFHARVPGAPKKTKGRGGWPRRRRRRRRSGHRETKSRRGSSSPLESSDASRDTFTGSLIISENENFAKETNYGFVSR